MLYILSIAVIVIFIIIYKNRYRTPKNQKKVPLVKGCLPIVGHSLNFSKDIISYIRQCYREYGKIFRLKIFKRHIIVICDRSMQKEYFKETEESMSLYEVLEGLYFGRAFFKDPMDFKSSIQIVKKTVAVRFDEFVPKIKEEAMKMINIMRNKKNQSIDLTKEMINFVANTSFRCFVSNEINSEFMDLLVKFTYLLNKIVVLTYFFPGWLLKGTVGILLDYYRAKMIKLLDFEIESYRLDTGKTDSMVLRKSVDYIDENGKTLNNRQIGEIVVCLLYVSSENTALGLSATITEIAKNNYWNSVKDVSEKYLADDDMQGLMSDEFINACVHEASRLNSHIFSLQRRPKNFKASIGGYHVGNADTVAMCEPMLMSLDCSHDVFSDPLTYNPKRFIKSNANSKAEPITPNYVMTWGAQSHHLCPGKGFALMEIKMATALIVTYFKQFVIPDDQYNNLDYFSPSAYAERKISIQLEPIDNILVVNKKKITKVEVGDRTYSVEDIGNGLLIRQALNFDEQVKYYTYVTDLAKGTKDAEEMQNKPTENAYPIAYHNLVYTGTSNCAEPTKLYSWANELVEGLSNEYNYKNVRFNSMYAQLYHDNSTMKTHKDEFVALGVSINLGVSCKFWFDNREILLHSGDVLIADFSKVDHGVLSILPESFPGWMSNDYLMENPIELYGRKRMSIQLRNVNKFPENLLSNEQFEQMLGK